MRIKNAVQWTLLVLLVLLSWSPQRILLSNDDTITEGVSRKNSSWVDSSSASRNELEEPDSQQLSQSKDDTTTPSLSNENARLGGGAGLSILDNNSSTATVLDCWFDVEQPLMELQHTWRIKRVPILTSMVEVHGTYRIVFILQYLKEEYDAWTEHANWTCNGIPTDTTNTGMSDQMTITKQIFVLTCPLDVNHITVSTIGTAVSNFTYETGLIRQCSDQDVSKGLPEGPTHNVVGCTMLRHRPYSELSSWLTYHRLIGYDHFWVYINEPMPNLTLPQASYITYVPWNYGFYDGRTSTHQGAKEQDCILRANARNVTWLALHDVDEYIQVLPSTDGSLKSILQSHEHDTSLGGLQLPCWFFGANQFYNTTSSSATTTSDGNDPLLIDYSWRKSAPYPRGREKMFVRPQNVDYFACHHILVGGPMKPEPRLRLNHYKLAHEGVFEARSQADIVLDDSLQREFGARLRASAEYKQRHI